MASTPLDFKAKFDLRPARVFEKIHLASSTPGEEIQQAAAETWSASQEDQDRPARQASHTTQEGK
jgi:hypothetical protein